MGVVTGHQWKPCDKSKSEDEVNKQSFCACVSASDVGFSIYLLSYYNKNMDILKKDKSEGDSDDYEKQNDESTHRKKRWSNQAYKIALDKYSNWCRNIKNVMVKLTDNEKKELMIGY